MGLRKDEVALLKPDFISEDRHWVYFGYGEGWGGDKCDKCCELLEKENGPNKYCINCWKLEIFFSNCTATGAVKEFLLELAGKDHSYHGKWLKEEMEFPEGKLTSIPVAGHPDPDVKKDGVILIYNQSIAERDRRKKEIMTGLKGRGLYQRLDLSYRRGCLNFDEIIGDWKEWYDLDEDYPE